MIINRPNHRLPLIQANTTEDLNIFQCLKQLPSDCPVRHIWNHPNAKDPRVKERYHKEYKEYRNMVSLILKQSKTNYYNHYFETN